MSKRIAKTLAVAVGLAAGLSSVLTALFLLRQGEFSLGMLIFMGWTVAPYALLAVLAYAARESAAAGAVILAGVLGAAGFAAWAYSTAFTPPVDAQAALVFIFVPAYQGAGALAIGLLALGAWALPRAWAGRRRP